MSETPRDCGHGQLARSCRICELERELAAMTASAELAERQVVVLCTLIDKETRLEYCSYCPARCVCHGATQCEKTLAAWSRAEAEKVVAI